MASALAQQLAQLKGLHAQERWTKGKFSLLFDYQKAADVSAETLLGIAQQGIGALCKADRRYAPFTDSLFSRASLAVSRDQMTKDENEQLNIHLRAFLRILVSHFLLPAAFQVLEYCIRRHEVHVYNVSDLLLCALPYHSTPEFARVVAVLQLKGGPWEWLIPCQQSGAPPPRELLVRRCVNDQAVIREVCKGAESVGVLGFVSRTYLSFYAVLLCEIFTAAPQVTEELLTVLLPYLVAGLRGSATRDYRAATLMVLTQLLARAQLAREFLTAVVPEVIRSAPELGDSPTIMLLAHMAASQPELKVLPAKSLQLLVEHCQTGQQLSHLQARGANLAPLLKLLLLSLAQALPQHPQLKPLLVDLLNQSTLDTELVQSAAVHLLQAGAAQRQQQQQQQLQDASAVADTSKQQHLQQVLRLFDLHYPDQLDAAINAALQAAASRTTTAAADDNSKKAASKPHKNQQRLDANLLFDFIQQCFNGSGHEVVAVEQQQALTLSLAVSAPASQMRLMALQKLDAICSLADASDSTRQLLLSSLQSCLRDDSFAVAGAAAGAGGLAAVPAEQVLTALQHLLARAAGRLSAGHTAAAAGGGGEGTVVSVKGGTEGSKDALKAAKAALTAVAAVGERAAANTEQQQPTAVQRQAAILLLEYALADKRLKKLCKAAVTVCCSCKWHPLLQLLASAPAVSAALQQDAAADVTAAVHAPSNRRKKGSQADAAADDAVGGKHANSVALNRALVQALADGVTAAGGSALLSEVIAASRSCGPRCLHLLQLALVKAATVGPATADAEAPTPSGKSRGRGKQQSTSSTQAFDKEGSASSAHIAAALLQMLEQQISPAAAKSGEPRNRSSSSSGTLLLPGDWEALAAAAIDDMALPTKQHYQQLHDTLSHLQAAVLLAGLKSVLAAAPAQALSALLGQPVQLFARLAQASAAGGQDSLVQHVQLLVLKSGHTLEQQLTFLAGVYGLPAGSCSAEVQVAALRALRPVSSSGQLETAADCGGSWFVQLLAAANTSHKDVRGAALDALLALPSAASGGAAAAGSLSASDISELVSALQHHQELLRGSAGALTPLLCSAVAATSMDMDSAAGSARGHGRARSKSSKAAAAAVKPRGSNTEDLDAEMQLSASCSQSLLQLLLTVLPLLHDESQLLAAELAVQVLAAASTADVVQTAVAAHRLLDQLLHRLCQASKVTAASSQQQIPVWRQLVVMHVGAAASDDISQWQQLRSAAAVSLMQFFTSKAFKSSAAAGIVSSYISLLQLPFESAAAVAAGLASQGTKLTAVELAAVAPVRKAATQQLDADMFAVLSPQQQQTVLTAVLQTHSADGDAACRAAARAALEQLPVTADMLVQLLQHVTESSSKPPQKQPQPQSRPKRAKRVSNQASSSQQQDEGAVVDPAEAALHPLTAADIDAAVAALELLQWKEDVQDKQHLLQPLQDLLKATVPLMGTITETYREADTTTAADGAAADAAKVAAAASPSAVGYATQLALLTLESLVMQYGTEAGTVDPALVLSCAAAAPDGAVRNAALLLLAVLAQLSPEEMLGHVLQALSVIQQSAALQEDSHSQAVASAVLSSLVPAWLAAGRGSDELWGSLLVALPGLPAPRRLRLLEALMKALPQESGLPVGLMLMLQRVVSSTAAPTPAGTKKHKKGKKVIPAEEELPAAPVPAAVNGVDESEWLPDLMAALCEQVPVPARLQAFSAVLASSLEGPEGPLLPAHTPLPRLAVTFVTANLKVRSVLTAAHAAAGVAPEGGSNIPTIQKACQSIMAQALQHLLQLNPTAAATQAAETPNKHSRRTHKAVRAAAGGVYELLAALEAVQDCPSYLQALVEMSRHPAESVQRRALKLLAARLLKAPVDLADMQSVGEGLSASQRQDKLQQLAQAGLAICQDLSRLLQSQAALTRQLALIAADAGTRQFGALLPGSVLSCLASVVDAAGDADAPTAVRVSALACIASAVSAVGPKLVPLLPQTAAVVLEAAQAACKDLQGFDHQLHKQQQQQDGSSSSDGEDDTKYEATAAHSKGEDAALQLAAALTALEAAVTSLGGFLSPHLKQVLQLLVHQQVLTCTTAGAAAAAARLRAALPVQVPARLLLEPLVSQWDFALAAGRRRTADAAQAASAEPAAALLELAAALCSSMQPATAVNYHETIVTLLLRALDTRHKWLAASAGHLEQQAAVPGGVDAAVAAAAAVGQLNHAGVHMVESAAVRALSALVMKLSESKFKPMFLRMVEWANAGSSTAADRQGLGRAAAFMAVVCLLAHRLRGVFTPYFKYFTVMHMKLLVGEGLTAEGKRPKKKHKKAAAAAGPELGLMVSGWLARLRAVHAVHLLALHDSAAIATASVQEQQERFDRLLPLVVEQLAEGPPAEVAAALSVEGADSALDLPGGPVAALGAAGKAAIEAGGSAAVHDYCDIVGTAAVGALIQMAAAAGSDVVWKPLHHAVLMATRGGSTRAKLLALGCVSRLAELLREEYLMLLPEALPFISELIEDGEVSVEGAAQGVIAQLEALSGEKLEQYLKT